MGNQARVVVCTVVALCHVAGAQADSSRRRKQKRPRDPAPLEVPAPAPVPAPEPAPPPPPTEETPWSKGITAERKAAAEQLLVEGNSLFVQNRFREALAQYEAAIAQWDHPAIHFNIVRTLISLERPLEAQVSLDKALAYGADPLDEHYTEALNYKRLIASQVATIEVSCKQAGVNIKLDGADLLQCPGSSTKRVLPGNHVIVGTKPDHQTETRDVVLVGGRNMPLDISLITNEEATVYKTRWATWKPWAVAGSGAVVAGLGLLLQQQAKRELDQLERAITATCPPTGCTEERYRELGHDSAESRALVENRVAIGMMIGGGAVVVAGIAAVIMNRPRAYLAERPAPKPAAQLVPSVSSAGGGLVLVGQF